MMGACSVDSHSDVKAGVCEQSPEAVWCSTALTPEVSPSRCRPLQAAAAVKTNEVLRSSLGTYTAFRTRYLSS